MERAGPGRETGPELERLVRLRQNLQRERAQIFCEMKAAASITRRAAAQVRSQVSDSRACLAESRAILRQID